MTTDEIKKLIAARPFTPFVIRTADGREVSVPHPETIAYGGGRIAVVVDGDAAEIIDLLMVPTIRSNAGKRKRKG
jgi:hypothetical protein